MKIQTNDDLQLSKEVLTGYHNILLVVWITDPGKRIPVLDACNSDTMILASINNDKRDPPCFSFP